MKWFISFLLIVALASLHLFIPMEATPRFLGFPVWLGIYAAVHLLFIVFLYRFGRSNERMNG